MYYKFIDEKTVERFEGGAIYYNNLVFANPTAEQLTEAGFKEVVEDEMPEFDPKTEYLKPHYVDGDVITKTWTVEIFDESGTEL